MVTQSRSTAKPHFLTPFTIGEPEKESAFKPSKNTHYEASSETYECWLKFEMEESLRDVRAYIKERLQGPPAKRGENLFLISPFDSPEGEDFLEKTLAHSYLISGEGEGEYHCFKAGRCCQFYPQLFHVLRRSCYKVVGHYPFLFQLVPPSATARSLGVCFAFLHKFSVATKDLTIPSSEIKAIARASSSGLRPTLTTMLGMTRLVDKITVPYGPSIGSPQNCRASKPIHLLKTSFFQFSKKWLPNRFNRLPQAIYLVSMRALHRRYYMVFVKSGADSGFFFDSRNGLFQITGNLLETTTTCLRQSYRDFKAMFPVKLLRLSLTFTPVLSTPSRSKTSQIFGKKRRLLKRDLAQRKSIRTNKDELKEVARNALWQSSCPRMGRNIQEHEKKLENPDLSKKELLLSQKKLKEFDAGISGWLCTREDLRGEIAFMITENREFGQIAELMNQIIVDEKRVFDGLFRAKMCPDEKSRDKISNAKLEDYIKKSEIKELAQSLDFRSFPAPQELQTKIRRCLDKVNKKLEGFGGEGSSSRAAELETVRSGLEGLGLGEGSSSRERVHEVVLAIQEDEPQRRSLSGSIRSIESVF